MKTLPKAGLDIGQTPPFLAEAISYRSRRSDRHLGPSPPLLRTALPADTSVTPAHHGPRPSSCGTTLRGSQGRLRLPPQAARTAGPPRTRTGRSINRAKRTLRPGRSTPPRGRHTAPDAPNPRRPCMKRQGDPPVTALIQPSGPPD